MKYWVEKVGRRPTLVRSSAPDAIGYDTERAAIRAYRTRKRADAAFHEEQAAFLRKLANGVVRKSWPK